MAEEKLEDLALNEIPERILVEIFKSAQPEYEFSTMTILDCKKVNGGSIPHFKLIYDLHSQGRFFREYVGKFQCTAIINMNRDYELVALVDQKKV